MLYIFHGEDDFTRKEALAQLIEGLGAPEELATNTTKLDGSDVTFDQLISVVNAVPFLADHRLVIVEGLLAKSNPPERQRGRASGTRARKGGKTANQWEGLSEAVKAMPPSTVLVLDDGLLHRDNLMLKALAPVAKMKTFEPLKGGKLQSWIRNRIFETGGQISPKATSRLLASYDGSLWRLAGDIEKLTLYAAGRAIEESDVEKLVAGSQDPNIFALVDAVVGGNRTKAFRQLSALLADGVSAFHILTMIGRQVRMMALAIDLQARRVPISEYPKHLGTGSRYAIDKVMEQASGSTLPAVTRAYEVVLETDLKLKSTDLPEDVALEMLVGELTAALRSRNYDVSDWRSGERLA